MDDFVPPVPLALDVQSLTMSLVNIASPSAGEGPLADSIEAALRDLGQLDVERVGHTVVARTDAGHDRRVVVLGHLTTASADQGPVADPLAYVEMGKLFGLGASDAKGALAVALKAATLGRYSRDVTFVYYAGGRNAGGPDTTGLSSLGDELLRADFALLAEPTDGAVRSGTLDHPWTQRLIELSDAPPLPHCGDASDLARLASLDVAAVAFGPGDPSLAGTAGEFVPTAQLTQCEFVLRRWLTA